MAPFLAEEEDVFSFGGGIDPPPSVDVLPPPAAPPSPESAASSVGALAAPVRVLCSFKGTRGGLCRNRATEDGRCAKHPLRADGPPMNVASIEQMAAAPTVPPAVPPSAARTPDKGGKGGKKGKSVGD